jgi:hypothetical protein
MLSGSAFLDRLDEEHIRRQAEQYRLTEVESLECWDCHVKYRLFGGPDLPNDEAEAKSDIKDLKARALWIIAKDCPSNVAEGEPKKASHPSSYRFYANGKIGV